MKLWRGVISTPLKVSAYWAVSRAWVGQTGERFRVGGQAGRRRRAERGEALAASRWCPATASGVETPSGWSIQAQLGLGVADDPLAALLGLGRDHDARGALLLDRACDRDLLLGEAHPPKLDGQPLESARVAAGRVHVRPGDLGHRVEAVQDVARQADLLGELGVDVDRIEIARCPGVAVR